MSQWRQSLGRCTYKLRDVRDHRHQTDATDQGHQRDATDHHHQRDATDRTTTTREMSWTTTTREMPGTKATREQGPQNDESINFYCCEPSVCGTLLRQPQNTHTLYGGDPGSCPPSQMGGDVTVPTAASPHTREFRRERESGCYSEW